MPTDAQHRNLASAHHALIAQHEATILWQAAEISKHIDKIALLEQQLAEARKDAERYRWLFKGNKVYSQFFAAYQPWDGSDGKAGFDASIDAAITSTREQTCGPSAK